VLILCIIGLSGLKALTLLSGPKEKIEKQLTISRLNCEKSCSTCPAPESHHIINSLEYVILWPILYTPTNISCRYLSRATTYGSGCVGTIGSTCFGNCLEACGVENFSWSSWIWGIHSITKFAAWLSVYFWLAIHPARLLYGLVIKPMGQPSLRALLIAFTLWALIAALS